MNLTRAHTWGIPRDSAKVLTTNYGDFDRVYSDVIKQYEKYKYVPYSAD